MARQPGLHVPPYVKVMLHDGLAFIGDVREVRLCGPIEEDFKRLPPWAKARVDSMIGRVVSDQRPDWFDGEPSLLGSHKVMIRPGVELGFWVSRVFEGLVKLTSISVCGSWPGGGGGILIGAPPGGGIGGGDAFIQPELCRLLGEAIPSMVNLAGQKGADARALCLAQRGIEYDLIEGLLAARTPDQPEVTITCGDGVPLQAMMVFHAVRGVDSRLLQQVREVPRTAVRLAAPVKPADEPDLSLPWAPARPAQGAAYRIQAVFDHLNDMGYGAHLWGRGLLRATCRLVRDPAWTLVELDASLTPPGRLSARISAATLAPDPARDNHLALTAWNWTTGHFDAGDDSIDHHRMPVFQPETGKIRILALVRLRPN